jgi:hypothetical protein
MKPTIAKLFIVVALRHAEHRRGVGHVAKVSAGDVAAARSLEGEGLVELGRAKAPDVGHTVKLTPKGRETVERLLDVLGRPTQVDLVDWLQQQRPEAN